jgi:hypothetical protein
MKRLRMIFFGALLIASCAPGGGVKETSPGQTAQPSLAIPTAGQPGLPSSTPSIAPSLPPSPTETPKPVTTAIPGLLPFAGEEGFVFSVLQKIGLSDDSLGVFFLGMEDTALRPITGPGLTLRGLSPDGQSILVEQGGELSVIRVMGGDQVLLTDQYLSQADHGAYWVTGVDRIVYIASAEEGNAIHVASPDGSQALRLTPPDINPVDLYPSGDQTRVYWAAGTCYLSGDCVVDRVGWSLLDGSQHVTLPEGIRDPAGSPNGDYLAYVRIDSQGSDGFYISRVDGSEAREVAVYGDPFVSYAWYPEGDKLALAAAQRWDYTGQIVDHRYYFVYPTDLRAVNLSYLDEPSSMLSWSPDGRYLLLLGTEELNQGFRATIQMVDFEVGAVRRWDEVPELTSDEYVYIPCVAWVK